MRAFSSPAGLQHAVERLGQVVDGLLGTVAAREDPFGHTAAGLGLQKLDQRPAQHDSPGLAILGVIAMQQPDTALQIQRTPLQLGHLVPARPAQQQHLQCGGSSAVRVGIHRLHQLGDLGFGQEALAGVVLTEHLDPGAGVLLDALPLDRPAEHGAE